MALGATLKAAITAALTLAATLAQADVQLVMVEEHGCMWCACWNAENAPIYPKTREGKAAPLRRIDRQAERPPDLEFARSVIFTPTFVLMLDGKEVNRIEGYPSEDFFWALFGKIARGDS